MSEKFPQLNNTPETQKKTEGCSYAEKVAAVAETSAIKEQINDLKEKIANINRNMTGEQFLEKVEDVLAKVKSKAEQTK
jgi:valyl-tRNA synthetase